jgi:hypothetical protein
MEFRVSNYCYLCVLASRVLQTDSKIERWRCRESKFIVASNPSYNASKRTHTILLCHFRNLCRQSSTKDKFVGFRKTHFFLRMFVGFKPEPICQEKVCNAQRKKNVEKKRIDNGLTYLGGSCLGGGVHLFSGNGFTQSSSLFSSLTIPEPWAFSFPLRSNGYRQTSSFRNKGFLLLHFQLSTPKAQQPSLCFLWVNYSATCL